MTDDIKALVAKLREKPSYWHQPTYEFLHSDAADAIEALEAENESLRITLAARDRRDAAES